MACAKSITWISHTPSTNGGRKLKRRKTENHDAAFDSISVKKVLGMAL